MNTATLCLVATLALTFLPTSSASAAAAAAEAEAANAPFARLMAAMREHEGCTLSPKLRAETTDAAGTFLVAGERVEKGEVLAVIPWNALVLAKVEAAGSDEDEEDTLSAIVTLAGTLAAMRSLHAGGAANALSPLHAAYLDAIPREYTTGLDFRAGEVACLNEEAGSYHKEMLDDFSQAERRMAARGAAPALVRWAYEAVRTRACTVIDGHAALIPLWDFLNHDQSPNVETRVRKGREVVLRAGEVIEAGGQLRNSYGDQLSPAKLLVNYGFADASFERVSALLSFEAPEGLRTPPMLRAAGCFRPSKLYFLRETGEPSKAVLACTALSLTDPKELQSMTQAVARRVTKENQWAALGVLRQHLSDIVRSREVFPHLRRSPCRGEGGALPLIRRNNEYMRQAYKKALSWATERLEERED